MRSLDRVTGVRIVRNILVVARGDHLGCLVSHAGTGRGRWGQKTMSKTVIDLSKAPGEGMAWDRPRAVVFLWAAVELLLVTNPWQLSSGVRVAALRAFGAEIGKGVIFRPRTRIKFPWKLCIGDRSWIGEGVWIHNQDQVRIGSDSVVSQETMITTGSHAHRRDMALITKPVVVGDGVWITARCMITGGVNIGDSSLIRPMTVVSADVEPNTILGSATPANQGQRFVE
jgi:putative colanic acid biosynthesis acetyltransferase WcaF